MAASSVHAPGSSSEIVDGSGTVSPALVPRLFGSFEARANDPNVDVAKVHAAGPNGSNGQDCSQSSGDGVLDRHELIVNPGVVIGGARGTLHARPSGTLRPRPTRGSHRS